MRTLRASDQEIFKTSHIRGRRKRRPNAAAVARTGDEQHADELNFGLSQASQPTAIRWELCDSESLTDKRGGD
jgi:hypothetical protein